MSTAELHRQWNDARQRHEAAYRRDQFTLAAAHAETMVEICRALADDARLAAEQSVAGEIVNVAEQKGKQR